MWSRADLKWQAKQVLGRSYWKWLLVTFVAGLVSGQGFSFTVNFSVSGASAAPAGWEPFAFLAPLLMWIPMILLGAALIFTLFVSGPMQVGACRFYFSSTVYQNDDLGYLFSGFRSEQYLRNACAMFLMDLYIFLWSLLFVIPGIVKSYEYRFIPYLLAEYPQMDRQTAFAISREMTLGHKWEMFVLDLSFLGWYFLGLLACGIGVLFVMPYVEATYAQLYLRLRGAQTA